MRGGLGGCGGAAERWQLRFEELVELENKKLEK